MKQPSKAAKPARAASRPNVRLAARDMAQVRAITAQANARTNSKALLLSGSNAAAAVEAIARDLRRDLFRVDLAAVVSQHIGVTRKNIDRLFAEAAANDAILLFDEADALFGRRSEVRDAHDRYANIEIGYLLQRMEEHRNLVLLVSKPTFTLPMDLQRRLSVYRFPPD
jgi:ATPase family associated with various cellular activities (AAA)